MRLLNRLLPALFLPLLIASGCTDDILQGEGALTFSKDTVIFDTVFTTIGSVTRQFKVYNPHSAEVNISSIRLAGGQQSKYRINVDGVPGIAFSNVRIRGGDSLFVFVDVTLDPNNLNEPAIVSDSVIFVTNGIEQDVDLVACGWDAHFFYPTLYNEVIGPYSVLPCNVTWTNVKPIVIYGQALVPENCSLTIEAGTRVYSHKYSGLLVDENASLYVNGELGNEVHFRSDRLDEFYRDQAGEWAGLWLYRGAYARINYAHIRNAVTGILMGPLSTEPIAEPVLELSNTIIENMSATGILAYTGKVTACNSVFGSSGQVSAALTVGGTYEFRHCTFANYWSAGNRQTPAVLLTNNLDVPGYPLSLAPLSAYFGNCIIYGNNINEVGTSRNASAGFDLKFDRCAIRADPKDVDMTDPQQFEETILNENPRFIDPQAHDFRLDTLSPMQNRGRPDITLPCYGSPTDLLGSPRPFGLPDLGAYERQD